MREERHYLDETEKRAAELLEKFQTTAALIRRPKGRTVLQEITRALLGPSGKSDVTLLTVWQIASLIATYSIRIDYDPARFNRWLQDRRRRSLPKPKPTDDWGHLVKIWLEKGLSVELLLKAADVSGHRSEIWNALSAWHLKSLQRSEAVSVIETAEPLLPKSALMTQLTCDLRDIFRSEAGRPCDALIGEMLWVAGLEESCGIEDDSTELRRRLKGRIERRRR